MVEAGGEAKKTSKLESLEDKVSRGVQNWVNSHLRDSSFSQNTDAWNHFMGGLSGLVEAVVKEVE